MSWKTIWVVALTNNVTQFEAVPPIGQVIGSHRRFHTRNITFYVTCDKNLSLNEHCHKTFKKEIATKVTKELGPIFFVEYMTVLSRAVEMYSNLSDSSPLSESG